MSMIYSIASLAMVFLVIASVWRLFAKAGESGWKSLVPIYNAVVLLKLVGRPGWWLLLMLVPVVNIIPAIMVCFDLARAFGKGTGAGLGILLLGPIFIMWLAFGDARYVGPTRNAPPAMKLAA
jgi:hypothetical protein